MNGYLNNLEETAMRLKGGWYDTGDLGFIDDDGYIWHKGRLKRFVKIAGEMVSLVAIEEALEQVTEPGIECCACLLYTSPSPRD